MTTPLPTEAKEALRKTVRGLRERLLADLAAAAEGAYRLSVRPEQAGLAEAARLRRARLDGWLEEQVRSAPARERKKDAAAVRRRFLAQAVEEAATTLLHRLVLLRHMEALELSRPEVVRGGWGSPGYRQFRDFAPALCEDPTEGYATLLGLLFDELALELPGLFGDVGLTRLFPVPPATLRAVVDALDAPALEPAWTDDTTLGWVYQFWNDPKREALDAKIHDGGKIEPHEIASKTQMFTERYMVEWLLHNSLGQMWLAMCDKHGWRAEARDVLDDLDARRAEWRGKRERGEVPLDALMPIAPGLEERWKYWVPQPMPEGAVEAAPESVRDLKILDPACGSGHFLVIAFDLLAALYREEARHRGEEGEETWSDAAVAASIVERNLHGIDIDPRAIQIAAAALWLKAKALAPDVLLRRMHLVAPALRLASLPEDDPALRRLLAEVRREAGIPEELTRRIVEGLAGADHLGSLLQVDAAVEEAVREAERGARGQLGLFAPQAEAPPRPTDPAAARATVLDRLEAFLAAHAAEEDLGLRLEAEQLAAGVRFVRMVREGQYDLVMGNPPYQGTSKMADAAYVKKHYPRGKADLYAAFLERGLELARAGGYSAMLTMRGWMFVSQFEECRDHLLSKSDLRLVADIDRGAFEDVVDDLVTISIPVFLKLDTSVMPFVALQPTPLADKKRDSGRTARKRAALLLQVGRYKCCSSNLPQIEGAPIVYWWNDVFRKKYSDASKLGKNYPAKFGLTTGDNTRFVRTWSEVKALPLEETRYQHFQWVPFILGAKGRTWFEPLTDVVRWRHNGLEVKEKSAFQYGTVSKQIRNEDTYFSRGIAFSMMGTRFLARVHRFPGVIGNTGASLFPPESELHRLLCLMNSSTSRFVLQSLNPGLHFEVGDVNRLPVWDIDGAQVIWDQVSGAFDRHETTRENSVEFRRPGPSPWRYAQDWAQRAVDRTEGEPLPPWEPEYDADSPEAWLSYAVGVALGRFGADGEGILDQAPETALPAGILFLSADHDLDSLAHPAAEPIHRAWAEHGAAVAEDDLRTWLRRSFFPYHLKLYENRPIYFPVSSAGGSFLAFVSIHRWSDATLEILLADHLVPERRRLEGELQDVRGARAAGDRAQQASAERRYAALQKLLEELRGFIEAVERCAHHGPPPTAPDCPPRERDAPFRMDLDDGVMINSAALWPLLEPQWKKPKTWWQELTTAKGRKDYDWAHLAARYFPERVDAKCRKDPSLAVAHGCFWRYHPDRAYAWELRLQDEIGESFKIEEDGAEEARARFLEEHTDEAAAIREKEAKRRARQAKKAGGQEGGEGPLFNDNDRANGSAPSS